MSGSLGSDKENAIPSSFRATGGHQAGKRKDRQTAQELRGQLMKDQQGARVQPPKTRSLERSQSALNDIWERSNSQSGFFPVRSNAAEESEEPARKVTKFTDVSIHTDARDASDDTFLSEGMVGVLRASMSRCDNGGTSLAGTSFPHPEPATSMQPSQSLPLQQQSSQQLPQQQHMVCGQHPPIDWTIKTCLRFSSAEELAVCSEAAMPSSEAAGQALSGVATSCIEGLTAQERWQAALMSWRYPASAWPREAVAALQSAPPAAPLLTQRFVAWQEGLRSLYHALRNSACNCFFLLPPQGSRQPFAVRFGASGLAGCQSVHAAISRSYTPLRAQLASAHYSVQCTAPLAPPKPDRAKRKSSNSSEGGWDPVWVGSGADGKPQSMLWFEGPGQVHGLFQYLFLEGRRMHGPDCDLPQLLAPVPFLGAGIHCLQSSVTEQAGRLPARPARPYRCEVSGLIPPWTVDRLCNCLQASSSSDFMVTMETDALTNGLQQVPAASLRQPQDLAPNSRLTCGGCMDKGEAVRWGQAAIVMGGAVLKELQCENGVFRVGFAAQTGSTAREWRSPAVI
ncbi:hypothetical protein WJX74_003646 [Apatococcus lobatus]|uniref:Uncharacterized protein n=1 Tax=Apatococcus lobatus TaxID=904363 RepID=A0AAW1QKR5_9CHLO